MKLFAMVWFCAAFAISCSIQADAAAASSPVDTAKLKLESAAVSSERDLVRKADLIAEVSSNGPGTRYPTADKAGKRRIVNYVQKMGVRSVLKGTPVSSTRVLTSGVEPLPDAQDPLNRIYTGPLAEGDYVLFLQKVAGTDLYSLVGLWQGVYPVEGGRTISLASSGFSSFGNLTIPGLREKIRALSR